MTVYDTSQIQPMGGWSPENTGGAWIRGDLASGSGTRLTGLWDVAELPPTLAKLSPEQLAGRKAQVQAAVQATLVGLESTIDG
ncbi:MAG: hypothetical protein GY745_15950 [Actinomycetia bacterium]|nr:hypothetical protein [Actinomycetes bacterium]MCP4086527.1 hypothetical protein [Actinomycetes bacterium]